MINSKVTDRLQLLTETAKTFAPFVEKFQSIKVKLTWELIETETQYVVVPNIDIDLVKS